MRVKEITPRRTLHDHVRRKRRGTLKLVASAGSKTESTFRILLLKKFGDLFDILRGSTAGERTRSDAMLGTLKVSSCVFIKIHTI